MHEEPLFLSCTDEDHTFDTHSRQRALEILEAEKKSYQLQLFTGVEHGFALRGDMENPYERELPPIINIHSPWNVLANVFPGYVKEQSLKGIVEWFDFWLSQ